LLLHCFHKRNRFIPQKTLDNYKIIFMNKKITSSCILATIIAIALIATFYGCKKDISPADRPYDLDVKLFGAAKNFNANGFIQFRQDADTARVIDLDTRVSGLLPDHAYQLQRAVNPIADSTGCSSTAWLTLGLGLVPLSIHTDAHGNGQADLWRAVTTIARGTQFHIHFQVIDSLTSTPVR
jgi:hypothetical protein